MQSGQGRGEAWAGQGRGLGRPAGVTRCPDRSGPRVEISCGAALGSPPITYSLLRKDGLLYTKESHNDGRPANFSLSLNQTSSWFRCQAENDHGVQFSPLRLLPPGERAPQLPGGSWPFWVGQWAVEDLRPATAKSRDGRCAAARPPLAPKEAQPSSPHPLTGQLPQVPTIVLAGSLASIAAVTASMLGWTLMPR